MQNLASLAGAAQAIGQTGPDIANIFGGGMTGAIRGAGNTYQEYLKKAMGALQQHEAAGRGDIEKYYGQGVGFGAPYRQAGQEALGGYLGSLGLGAPGGQQRAIDTFRASPGYQFALQQGTQGVQRQMAARGLGGSGAEMAALQRTGQGLADQEFGQYQQRLSGLAGAGEQAGLSAQQGAFGTGGQLAQLGLGYGGQIAGMYGTMGQAQAEAQMAAEKAKQESAAGIGKSFGAIPGLLASII